VRSARRCCRGGCGTCARARRSGTACAALRCTALHCAATSALRCNSSDSHNAAKCSEKASLWFDALLCRQRCAVCLSIRIGALSADGMALSSR
jgi:hypothetical protein